MSLATAAAIGECVLRLFPESEHGRLRVLDPVFHHGLRPRTTFHTRWGDHPVTYHIDALGFRDSSSGEVALRPSPGRPRILFLGDSFTEGVGVPQADTFVARFADATGEEALNGGVVSHCPLLEYLRLKELFRVGFRCYRVILMLDPSDVQDELVYDAMVRTDATLEPVGFGPRRGARLAAWVYNHSALARTVYLRGRTLLGRDDERERRALALATAATTPAATASPTAAPGPTEPARERHLYAERALWSEDPALYERWGRAGVALVKRDLLRIRDLCAAHQTRFSVVIYPWPQQLRAAVVPDREERLFGGFAWSNGIHYVNLFEDFRAYGNWKELFIDGDVHWNARGHAFVADALARRFSGARERH